MKVTRIENNGPYFVGDRPATPVLIGLDVDPTEFANAEVHLRSPEGVTTTLFGVAEVHPDGLSVDLAGNYFTESGLWAFQVVLTGPGIQQTLGAVYVPIEAWDGWATTADAELSWSDAPDDAALLFKLLDLAKAQVVAFAPALAEGAAIPANYREGQILQARAIWNSVQSDPNTGGFGVPGSSYTITPRPLDLNVRQLLRPKKGVPALG